MNFLRNTERNLFEIKLIEGSKYTISDFEFIIKKENNTFSLQTDDEFIQEICHKVTDLKLEDLDNAFIYLTEYYDKLMSSALKVEEKPLYEGQDVFEDENDNHDIKFEGRVRWKKDDFNMDIFLYIFEFLPPSDVFKINRVSKEWKKISENENLWETIMKREGKEKTENTWRESFKLIPLKFDEKKRGLLYYIATKGFTTEITDPNTLGVRPFSDDTTHNLTSFIQLKPCVTQIADIKSFNHYLGFNISETKLKILPESYWIQHRNDYDDTSLRNWVLEASNDKKKWDILMNHENDTSLEKKRQSEAHWKIIPKPTKLYSMFRIRQTGPNSHSHVGSSNYLNIGGIEIYGGLKK